jgi:hypothetical protein
MLLAHRSIFVAVCSLLVAHSALEAQDVRTIEGQVVDAADNAPLPGTVIMTIGPESAASVVAGPSGFD